MSRRMSDTGGTSLAPRCALFSVLNYQVPISVYDNIL